MSKDIGETLILKNGENLKRVFRYSIVMYYQVTNVSEMNPVGLQDERSYFWKFKFYLHKEEVDPVWSFDSKRSIFIALWNDFNRVFYHDVLTSV